MIENELTVSDKTVSMEVISKTIEYGKALIAHPIELLEGVEEVLSKLKGSYRLVVATKGDLLDQERKLRNSGIEHYFHHIEIMSDKQEADYKKLIKHLDIQPSEFMMIGNSLKSDVMPVLALGGHACHVPYHTTWAHEQVENTIEHENFRELKDIREFLSYLPQ